MVETACREGLLTGEAPVVKEVMPNWHTTLFNGSFLHENVYRQSASPEVDNAWEALGVNCRASELSVRSLLTRSLDRSIVVRPEEAEQSGLRHDQVKISQAYGGGYPANVEGLHHLHCLVSDHIRGPERNGDADTCRILSGRRCIGTMTIILRGKREPS